MREIKFRAWDKDKKCFVFPGEGFATNLTYWADPRTISVYLHKNIVLTQYTGLKDNNGVEIYEGDIWLYELREKPFAVVFDGDRAGWFPFADSDGCGCCSDETFAPEYGVIIGNIHENPELLEASK